MSVCLKFAPLIYLLNENNYNICPHLYLFASLMSKHAQGVDGCDHHSPFDFGDSSQCEASNLGGEDPGVTDTVTWRVGDKWVYAGAFDPTVLVQDAGVDAVVGTINGDAITTVDAVSEIDVEGVPTLVYETSSKADFDKGGVALEGYTGNLFIQYQVDEVRRVSDLSKTVNGPVAEC